MVPPAPEWRTSSVPVHPHAPDASHPSRVEQGEPPNRRNQIINPLFFLFVAMIDCRSTGLNRNIRTDSFRKPSRLNLHPSRFIVTFFGIFVFDLLGFNR